MKSIDDNKAAIDAVARKIGIHATWSYDHGDDSHVLRLGRGDQIVTVKFNNVDMMDSMQCDGMVAAVRRECQLLRRPSLAGTQGELVH